MPNYAVIQNNLVINAVVSDSDYAATQDWVLLPDGAGIGWSYSNGTFVDNRPKPDTIVAIQLEQVTKEQLMQQLSIISEQIKALS